MAGDVLEFTDDNFQAEVVQSTEPVLVDFWAPWCGPCRMLAPTVDEIASEYKGRVRVGKVNTDDNPQVASSLGISGIPTLMVFKGGEVVERLVGLQQKPRIASALDKHL
ncbi:MAG TPA: thioredoxin [Planctomycetaceae bacterium]|jgi:thioredoxin 1|nr:thioredoxin [Planctomycetaceae bacterium]